MKDEDDYMIKWVDHEAKGKQLESTLETALNRLRAKSETLKDLVNLSHELLYKLTRDTLPNNDIRETERVQLDLVGEFDEIDNEMNDSIIMIGQNLEKVMKLIG